MVYINGPVFQVMCFPTTSIRRLSSYPISGSRKLCQGFCALGSVYASLSDADVGQKAMAVGTLVEADFCIALSRVYAVHAYIRAPGETWRAIMWLRGGLVFTSLARLAALFC